MRLSSVVSHTISKLMSIIRSVSNQCILLHPESINRSIVCCCIYNISSILVLYNVNSLITTVET